MADELHAIPSRDPANEDSLLGMARQVLDKFLQQIDDCLPARVVSYDRQSNRAAVLPLVKVLTTDGRQVGRAQIASVPVLRPGGGGAVLSFNLTAGDLGWIKANDRDISLIMQGGRESAPNTLRKHSFQDALFIPDAMREVIIQAEDLELPVWQTLPGDVRIALWQEFVKLTAPRGLLIADDDGEHGENTLLDVRTTVKGARPWPQMTTGQRDAIPVTAADEGLAIWNLDTHKPQVYNGSAWGDI